MEDVLPPPVSCCGLETGELLIGGSEVCCAIWREIALIAISRGTARLPSDQVCRDLTSRTPGARLKVLRTINLQGAY